VILVWDDVLHDPAAYRQQALAQPFRSVTLAPRTTFHGIAPCADARLPALIATRCPAARPGLSFFRRSPLGQAEPNFVHTDRDMGDWTAILYLNPLPPLGDGTTFWRHKGTGATTSRAVTDGETRDEQAAWGDRSQWAAWRTVDARLNRLVLFDAPYFHSRALPENYGTNGDARLIQVVFGTGSLSPEAPWL
jgi:hypothetical protein